MDDGEIHSLCLELLARPSAGAGSPDGGELCVLHRQLHVWRMKMKITCCRTRAEASLTDRFLKVVSTRGLKSAAKILQHSVNLCQARIKLLLKWKN